MAVYADNVRLTPPAASVARRSRRDGSDHRESHEETFGSAFFDAADFATGGRQAINEGILEVDIYTPGPWLIHLQTLATHAGTVPDPAGVRHERKCAAHRARARAYAPQRWHRRRAARAGPRY